MSARRPHVTRQAGYRGLVHQPLTSGTRGHFSAFASSKRIPELDGHLFGPQVQRQLRWPRESVRAVVGLQYPSSFNVGTRLQYAVLSITDNHVVLVAQSKPNHACFLVHQQLGIAPSPLFPHFVAATAQRGKLRVEFCFILPTVPPCAAQEHRWKERWCAPRCAGGPCFLA